MIKMFRLVTVLGFLLIIVGNTTAGPVEFIDVYDAGHEYMAWWETNSWEFDITDNGFDPNTMEITEATIELVLEDDKDRWCFEIEWSLFTIGEEKKWLWKANTNEYDLKASSLLTLSETGKIGSSLKSMSGDFYFHSATLTAKGTENVPEPATLSLIFLSGICFVGAKFRRKK